MTGTISEKGVGPTSREEERQQQQQQQQHREEIIESHEHLDAGRYDDIERGDSGFPTLRATASNVLKTTASNALTKVASRMTTRSLVNPGPPPDGGLKAWTQVAMCWLVLFMTWGYTNSFGTFQQYYASDAGLNLPPSTVSWIGSMQVFLTFFSGAFSGRLLDAGLFVPTFLVGCFMQLLGIFMMSLSTKFWQLFLTQGVLTGIGGGIFFCPSVGLVVTYFDKKRALAIALATTGNSTGGIVYPLLVRELLPRLGFGWTTRVLGFLNMAGLMIVLTFMRPRLPPRKAGPLVDLSAFKELPFVLFAAGMFFIMWASYFVFYFIASFGVSVTGMTFEQAASLVMIINGVGIPTRLIPPVLADRYIGVLNTFIPALFATALLSYAWLGVSTQTGFYVWTAFYGIANSGFQCLIPTALSRLTPDLTKTGTRMGMAFSIMSIGALTGPPVGGALLEVTEQRSYVPPRLWMATACLVGACLVAAARVKRNGWSLRVKC